MKIPREKFDEIAQANDIVDVISQYLSLKKRGKSFLALCPFHPDKNPSLHVSQEKQVYHCFSCKASGNVFSFVQNFEKITFIDAVQKLAQRAGIILRLNTNEPDLTNEISTLFEINKSAAIYFQKNLQKISSGERDFVLNYLGQRKVDSKIVQKFGIGYSSKSWDGLLNYFLEEDIFQTKDIEKAGLIVRSESDDKKIYDRFRGRLIFPIYSENDKIVGFGGRKLYEDDPGGKYINSPETKIYNKSRVLYGLNFSKERIRHQDYVILVEGYMDIISMHRNGIENVVASSGTALTEEQVKLISRYTKNIFMLFDSDYAGIKAAKRGIEIILEAGLDLEVITLPDNEDPDSFLNKYGREEFLLYIEKRKSVISFISEIYKKENKLESVIDKSNFVKEIIGYIGRIPDMIKRAFYIKEISQMYSLYESDLRAELDKSLKENKAKQFPKSSVVIPSKKSGNVQPAEKISQEEIDLVDLFVNGDEEAVSYLENNIETGSIKNPVVLKIVEYLLNQCMDHGKIEISKCLDEINDEDAKKLIGNIALNKHEVSFFSSTYDNILNATIAPVYNLKFAKDVIKKIKLRDLESERNELKKDPDKVLEIFEITKEINELKKQK